jgi:hypothetical protein
MPRIMLKADGIAHVLKQFLGALFHRCSRRDILG